MDSQSLDLKENLIMPKLVSLILIYLEHLIY